MSLQTGFYVISGLVKEINGLSDTPSLGQFLFWFRLINLGPIP